MSNNYKKVGRVKWFAEQYCAGCDEDCVEGGPRWLACVLTNILFEVATQGGKYVYKKGGKA